jgi:hypothetical protein
VDMSKQSWPPDEEDRWAYIFEDAHYVRSSPYKNIQKKSELAEITKESRNAYDSDSDGDNEVAKVDKIYPLSKRKEESKLEMIEIKDVKMNLRKEETKSESSEVGGDIVHEKDADNEEEKVDLECGRGDDWEDEGEEEVVSEDLELDIAGLEEDQKISEVIKNIQEIQEKKMKNKGK